MERYAIINSNKIYTFKTAKELNIFFTELKKNPLDMHFCVVYDYEKGISCYGWEYNHNEWIDETEINQTIEDAKNFCIVNGGKEIFIAICNGRIYFADINTIDYNINVLKEHNTKILYSIHQNKNARLINIFADPMITKY